ncbi:hypothetical protein RND71_016648 [Anisodus tanguticus]|uniref:Calponin-homology (CH) domain-containing protein n=1 Tax=Anisodus tanguticus TaxID=243964 RepID=A0AAE1VMF2_9SOLA|nr:hypothetical protein RND71_016648 [Anisodus tanguticus]
MGGYRAIAGDSSKSSVESNFRQLDDVFLQTQTRIWLGEVLNIRLDEHLHISDLLADGDLLFEVSKLLWNMLLAKCGELRHLKYEPLGSRRCSGRYMPYSNVDSFLKICKILGLNGIDLFSPSDVVEKKNIRKVCICLRALSNKARSKQLKVPDFDLVTYTVVMPKNMVGGIRRCLETSQSSLSSSSGYYSSKERRAKDSELTKRNKITESEPNYDSLSEESDEAESKFVGEESCCSSTNQLEDDNVADSDADNSFGEYSAVSKNGREKISVLSCPRDHHHRTSRGNGGKYITANDRIHFDHSDLNVENDESVVGDSMYDNEMEDSCISNYLSFSDSIIGGTDGSTPILREEVSSTTSMSSVLCRVHALDFDDQFDADECFTEETSSSLLENEADRQHKDSPASHKAWNVASNELIFHDTKEPSVKKPNISAGLSELTYSCSDELLSASAQPLTDKFASLHRNNSNYFDPDEDREAARSKDKVCLDTACRNNLSLVDRSEGCDGDSEVVSSTCEILDGVNMDRSSVISANCCEHIEKGHPCSCSVYGSGDASEVCEPTLPGDDREESVGRTVLMKRLRLKVEAEATIQRAEAEAEAARQREKQVEVMQS